MVRMYMCMQSEGSGFHRGGAIAPASRVDTLPDYVALGPSTVIELHVRELQSTCRLGPYRYALQNARWVWEAFASRRDAPPPRQLHRTIPVSGQSPDLFAHDRYVQDQKLALARHAILCMHSLNRIGDVALQPCGNTNFVNGLALCLDGKRLFSCRRQPWRGE